LLPADRLSHETIGYARVELKQLDFAVVLTEGCLIVLERESQFGLDYIANSMLGGCVSKQDWNEWGVLMVECHLHEGKHSLLELVAK